MTRNRAGVAAVLSGLLVVASQPALAQSTASSSTEEAIWGLNFELLAVAIPITILVEAILFYTVWRFRSSNVEEAKPTKENRRLEITWTIATAIVLLFVGIGAYGVLAQDDVSGQGEADMEVQVFAERYAWSFEYPDQNVSSNDQLVIPVNQTVKLNITSKDWLHAFHVPELGLKSDAFPEQSNYLVTTPQQTGTYQLYCAEYCGAGHSVMMSEVNVTTQEKYESWLAAQQDDAVENSTAE
ncbi:cytochrome c oxidase subunit II [Halapricum desulfuricans]|uniref:cytochrome-c oxidase n=1 Tax=Halapricum desulfuricans TaxID=2841257 RepID=A0A897NW65_9EURY|nr:cytochrome c oxidase subunit II [Halapricum desulfuricans]QSG14993.1 Heme/copper-type cytochrome/quinol oxidase, subunit 2 [Halapricum desulfuricans]